MAAIEFSAQLGQDRPPSPLATFRLVLAIQEGDLLREDQPGAAAYGEQFHGRQGYGDPGVSARHGARHHDPGVRHETEFARIWQRTEKIVVSKRLKQVSSKHTRIVDSLGAQEVRRLKEEATRDVAVSGPTLAASFISEGLVDEIGIYYVPVAVGGGTPFFKELETTLKFERIEAQPFKNGVVFMRYRLCK